MPNQAAFAVENNFKNGLITEATGLNFPENACTSTDNCVFNFDGSVSRRLGFDFEDDFTTKTIDRNNSVVSTYLWKNVAGVGTVSVLVQQVGATLYFYEVDGTTSTSLGAKATTVSLTAVSGAPTAEAVECQYASGNGVLFVTHPYCEPFYVSYDISAHTATGHTITLKIRDFEGDTADASAISERVAGKDRNNVSKAHLYNLYNQGWNLANLTIWDAAQTYMPSNADVMWRFVDSAGTFDAGATQIAKINPGNTLASKGHYIINLASSGRNTLVSADDGTTITTVTETTTGAYRPSTCAFFAGRVFYSGIQVNKFNTSIYFSQIIERDDQYGFCYQNNDPTSKDEFDLLPSDGGVITIPEAGTIIKLVTVTGGLMVFAQKGVWFITGSTGIGFTANDFTQIAVSSVTTLSHTSFVNIANSVTWWTAEGIYLAESSQNASPTVKRITFEKIQSYYDSISLNSKKTARGAYNYITNVVQWIFKETTTGNLNDDYEFDSVLNLNVGTGAFYPWTIPSSAVKINSLLLLDGSAGLLITNNVIDDSANLVIDDSSNQVITFSAVNSGVVPQLTYLVSYANGGSYKFTFASARNTNYLDWLQYDEIGQDFDSYFVTGYKLRGQGIRRWHHNWLRIFSENTVDTKFTIKGLWDYATSDDTNRWSEAQTITNSLTNYSNISKRVKIRGHGLVLQLKVESVAGYPFEIIGWAEYVTGNQLP